MSDMASDLCNAKRYKYLWIYIWLYQQMYGFVANRIKNAGKWVDDDDNKRNK